MDQNSLDELLRKRAGDAASLPPNFQQRVWRQIRQSRASQTYGLSWSTWQLLLRPQFVAMTLGVAVFVGVGLGARQSDRTTVSARQALNLEVFGANPGALPSTVLSAQL